MEVQIQEIDYSNGMNGCACRLSLSIKKRDSGQKVSKLTPPPDFGFRGIVNNSITTIGKFCSKSEKISPIIRTYLVLKMT